VNDEILGRGVTALERAANALELLAQDPVIHVEVRPPECPHCQTRNPKVRVEESAATGKMGEFVIQAHCTHCNEIFYGLPLQWDCVRTTDEAREILAEREELSEFDFNGGTDQGAPPRANAARASGL
jgi:bacterioferritin-associated ferredoxin